MTRDRWLSQLAKLLRPEIERRTGLHVRAVTVSADPGPLLGQDALGECHYSNGGRDRITVNANLTEPLTIATIVAHELLHAALPPDASHDWRFIESAARIGLHVDADGLHKDDRDLRAWVAPIIGRLPPYPAADAERALFPRLPLRSVYLVVSLVMLAAVAGTDLGKQGLSVAVLGGYVMPVFSDTLATQNNAALLLRPLFGWHLFWLLPLVVALGLSDNGLARRPGRRLLWQIAACAAPIAAYWLARSFAPASLNSDPWLMWEQLQLWRLDPADPVYQYGRQLEQFPFMVAGAVGLLFSVPVALALWFSRPFARSYRIGKFTAPTPPFLLQHGQHFGIGYGYTFNRSSPDALGRVMVELERCARFERARRGLLDRRAVGNYRAQLDPVSGFLVEQHDNSADYVCEVVGLPSEKREKEAKELGFGEDAPKHGRIITVAARSIGRNDPLAPASTEKGGARFGWVFGDD